MTTLQVHHLNCGTMRPLGRQLSAVMPRDLVAHCLVLDPAETASAQVSAPGFAPGDVTDIVLTHLDPDRPGGLADFPHATVHVGRAEHHAAMHPVLRERLRYLPAHWSHVPRWRTHDVAGESWQGFQAVTVLTDDVLLVPLVGHTRGHSGVAGRRAGGR